MSRSTDPGHFFQTDASEATRERKTAKSSNKNGNPIKLQSKILSVIADPDSSTSVYLAESAGCIRRVDIKSRNTRTVYRGPSAPVTSIAIGGIGGGTIFAGCWDKDIWSWNRETQAVGTKFKGHSDFVKTIICAKLGEKEVIISGGADTKIIVWDIATGTKIHTIRDKLDTMLALQYLTLDPIESSSECLIVLSSSSDPAIRQWSINPESWSQILNDVSPPTASAEVASSETINAHETSVYSMIFTSAVEAEDSDLWTASADGTAKCLSRSRKWEVEESLEHGDYVRSVVISSQYVITAGRNEDVKLWDRTTGNLWHVYEGHYEEVTGLVLLVDENGAENVISVSIDGTVRVWPLSKKELDNARMQTRDKENGVVKEETPKPAKKGLLTAEEEAELAELMSDSE